MIKPGVWVKIKSKNAVGFVLEASYHGAIVYVIENGKPDGKHKYSYHRLVALEDELNTEDLLELARLAVDLNQKEWFMEITDRLREIPG
ncbi:hypothetical protein JOC78_001671 [Bacillus ectoiniformans]|uniref:hypothetical protein n=1 Tax=Bacillus ectoiniformans TaxID=1494429 RepID=UPI001956CB04|nr:hypothetical protein [Bacillus ectoiniformans]MBM7648725.1 hypothetical protein [Bacillus ectoiniformans]